MKTNKKEKARASTEPVVLHPGDLPLCCPRPEISVWNLHPRVYLPIEETKDEHCPYCGTHYVLQP